MSQVTEATLVALRFLDYVGTDCVGVIDDEGKLAAALMFSRLAQEGLVASVKGPDGPIFSLTEAGRRVLRGDLLAARDEYPRLAGTMSTSICGETASQIAL